MDLYPPKRTIRSGLTLMAVILVAGLGLGLLLSRGIKPPRFLNTNVAGLNPSSQEQYTILVGAGYALGGDLEAATAKLERLEMPNISLWVANLLDRYVAEGQDPADIRALSALAHGLGIQSPPVLAYLATTTPRPSRTPFPTLTPAPTGTLAPTSTPGPTEPPAPAVTEAPATATTAPPTEGPTSAPPTDTPPAQPTDTQLPPPTRTPVPQPTSTVRPQPSSTPAAKWTYSAQLVGPGIEGQTCSDGFKLIRVTVMDAGGAPLSGVWVYEKYSNQYLPSGHKGDDPFWGPGDVELSGLDGGQVCIATGDGGACESTLTRDLPCHDPPPFEDLWAAGYCECCEVGITQERCRELVAAGSCLGISHYAWRVEFKRSW